MNNVKKIAVIGTISFLITLVGGTAGFGGFQFSPSTPGVPISQKNIDTHNLGVAYFAGGCFWCIESIFDGTPGVASAISGYLGGSSETANYSQISTGRTQHREGVQVFYNPEIVSFKELAEIFWRQIDPTDAGGQFADRGFQYTTAMYYSSLEEKKILEASKETLIHSGKFEKEIATLILPVSDFYIAEEEHQDYAQKQTLHYKSYELGSGRAGYKKNIWSNDNTFRKANIETQAELKARLTPLQYKVTQENGTERAFSEGNYHDNKEAGIYVDIIDGTPLYSSLHKYDSGTGWPSFWRPINEKLISLQEDTSLFSKRIEIRSLKADSHLGHLFPDGPNNRGGMRHCINGASLKFIPVALLEESGYGEYLDTFSQ